jgi:hypothetical protein
LTAARRGLDSKRWQTVSRHLMEGVGEAAGVGLGVEADTKRGQVLRDMLMNEWNGTD